MSSAKTNAVGGLLAHGDQMKRTGPDTHDEAWRKAIEINGSFCAEHFACILLLGKMQI